MAMTSNASQNDPSNKAYEYVSGANIDLSDLSPENVKEADKFLENVYKEWRSGKLDDLVAYEIGQYFEGEPIHHLMSVSVYPLCDIWFHMQKGDLDSIKKK